MKTTIQMLLLFPLLLTAQIQYTMPGEDMQHEGTWLQWPHNFTYPPWHQDDNEPAFIEMVAALETGENVHIIVYDANEKTHVQQALTTASISLTNAAIKENVLFATIKCLFCNIFENRSNTFSGSSSGPKTLLAISNIFCSLTH